MTFSIIGTGNIACFLGARFVAAGHHCTGIYARKKEVADLLAETLYADKYGTIADIYDGEADVCFLAISDTAIATVAKEISFKKTVLIHTAGAVSIDTIKTAARDCGVFWPIYSILKNSQPKHRDIPCAWEASTDKAARYLKEMAHAVTDTIFEANYDQRKWLHLAAVMSNNFINHLLAVCDQICKENQLPFTTLLPIIEQTFDRVKHNDPHKLQTGPAIRRDATTIQAHIALLQQHPAWQKIYEAMSASIQAG